MGDCDSDSECMGNLLCYQRSGKGTETYPMPPGCYEGDGDVNGDQMIDGWDYCIHPHFLETLPIIDEGVEPGHKIGWCAGDCDSDKGCYGDLKCFQRTGTGGDAPPGCSHRGWKKDWDYCYHPHFTGKKKKIERYDSYCK